MIQTVKIALVTVIENNEGNINSTNGHFKEQRFYADEAIKCFKSWRDKAGWLAEVNIYAICPTKNTLNDEYQEKLKELNVTYIEEYMPETETFAFGFYNVPLAMAWAEKNLTEDILLHTDLDMSVIRPLPEDIFNSALSGKVTCGQYDDNAIKDQRDTPANWDLPFDTGFIISRRNINFYQEYNKQMLELLEDLGDVNPYDVEEYIIDRMHNVEEWKSFDIVGIQKYQIGEGYPSIDTFSTSDLESVYFWHEHIMYDEHYDIVKEHLKYHKRMREV